MARNHKAGGQGEPHAARVKSATCITIAVLQALCQPLPLVLINFGDHRRFPNLTASVRPPYVRSAPSRRPAPCADRSTGRGADRLAADLAPSTRPELGPVVAPTRSSIASGRTAFQIASSHRRLYAFSADHDRGGFRAILLHNDEDPAPSGSLIVPSFAAVSVPRICACAKAGAESSTPTRTAAAATGTHRVRDISI